MKLNNTLKLAIAVAVSELAGIVGSVFTSGSIQGWYATLNRPPLNPPSWLFGPVWVTLYALMGISLWLVWKSDSREKKKAISLFGAQLILNALWSPVFFGAHSIGSALVIIVLLWAAIVLTMKVFNNVSRTTGWLLMPYIAWVSFALYLNLAYWLLN